MVAQEPRSVKSRNATRDIGRGSIVNIGSADSYAALPGKVAYVTSKHAMMGIKKPAGESSGPSSCPILINIVQSWIVQARACASMLFAHPGSALQWLKQNARNILSRKER